MLIWAKRKPYLTMMELYKDVGLSGYKGNKSKLELVRAGFADEVELPANRRDRRKKLLQTTPRGNEYPQSLGVRVEAKGRGGVNHLYYQKKIKERYESHGYTAEIEATIGKKSFNLLAIARNGRGIGVEIVRSMQNEGLTAEKASTSGVGCVLFVCETKVILERLRQMLGAIGSWPDGAAKHGLKLVSDYLGDEWKEMKVNSL